MLVSNQYLKISALGNTKVGHLKLLLYWLIIRPYFCMEVRRSVSNYSSLFFFYLIQGLIIDAFGELRDQQEQVKEDMEVSCKVYINVLVLIYGIVCTVYRCV